MRIPIYLLAIIIFISACSVQESIKNANENFLTSTGLEADSQGEGFATKIHNGYPVLFRAQMGDVWNRYAARLVIGETGRELGRIGQFLSGSHEYVGTVVGSPLDRILSKVIGQPLTFYIVLKHQKNNVSRLDIISDFSTVQPEDSLPKFARIGFSAGSLYTSDTALGGRVMSDKSLVENISELRSQYIRLDDKAVTFVFAGSETDWSAEIREHDGYDKLILSIMNILSGIADKI